MANREAACVSTIQRCDLLEKQREGTRLNVLVGQPHAGKCEEQQGIVFRLEVTKLTLLEKMWVTCAQLSSSCSFLT